MFPRILVGAVIAIAASADGATIATAHVESRYALGGAGGWDYPSVDAKAQRLYLSRGDHVQVVDTKTGKELATIADTPGVHGIALAPQLGRGYISCGRANLVKVFDLNNNAVLASVATGENPDAILFDPATRRVFAFNGRGHSASVIDTRTNQVVATIALGGKPEFARADGRGAVFVNIEDTAELAVLDARAAVVTARVKLPGCEEPAGLAFDAVHRRSFSTCANKTMVVVDVDHDKSIANVPIGAGSDGAEFDARSQTILSANGEGNLSFIHEIDADHYEALPALATQPGARTLTLDEDNGRLFLPTAQFEHKAPSDDAHTRRKMIPDTFVVLVVDLAAARSRSH
ncbi:MAG: YncE family protein [Rudaea sp.]